MQCSQSANLRRRPLRNTSLAKSNITRRGLQDGTLALTSTSRNRIRRRVCVRLISTARVSIPPSLRDGNVTVSLSPRVSLRPPIGGLHAPVATIRRPYRGEELQWQHGLEQRQANTTMEVRAWEFGRYCIWSPALDRRVAEGRYGIMRAVKEGDWAVNCYDFVVSGISKVAEQCKTTKQKPPNAGPWAYSQSFYRIDLKDFRPIDAGVSLTQIARNHREEIQKTF